jgi:cardiolipin synthase
MMQNFPLSRLLTLHTLIVLFGLGIYILTSHVRRQRRHPSAALAWVVSLSLIPYIALPLYFLFGNRKAVKVQTRPLEDTHLIENSDADTLASRFQHIAAAMGLTPPDSYSAFVLHQDGAAALIALLCLTRGSRKSLSICTFLIGQDVVGEEVQQALIDCAKTGVKVRLLIDGLGVYLGGKPHVKNLTAAGVEVAFFVSPLRSLLESRTNLRNHRKLIIADGQHVWSGGRNIAAEYFAGDLSKKGKETPWVDLSFEFQGRLAERAQQQFDRDWAFATQNPMTESRIENVMSRPGYEAKAQLVPSGPDQKDDTVYSLLVTSCFTARSRIQISTPYFVPDATLLMALTLASRRGVLVDLLLPQKSNHRMADVARYAALRDLSSAGGRVWMFPRMIHAKVVVIDDQVAMAGSANLDERSLFLNYELMIAFFDPNEIQSFSGWIDRVIEDAALYVPSSPGFIGELSEGFVRSVAFQL